MVRGSTPGAPVARCLAIGGGATLAAGSLLGWLVHHLIRSLGDGAPSRFDALLVAGSELVAATGAAWLWLLVCLVVRDALRGRGARPRAAVPGSVRGVVLAACGLSLAASPLAPAHASPRDPPRAGTQVLVGLSVPDRVTATQPRVSRPASVRRRTARPAAHGFSPGRGATVVVATGDTLWSIAARTLAAGATAADIDREWRRIHRANEDLIGADPHLILPGQQLVLPTPSPDHREE